MKVDPNWTPLQVEYYKVVEQIQTFLMKHPYHPVRIIAVSKKQPVWKIEELYSVGHRDFGENYAQDLVQRAEQLKQKGLDEMQWHFIGHLQTNKVKMLVPHLTAIHSLDSLKLLNEFEKHWKDLRGEDKLDAFIQVNVDSEESKSGMPPDEVPDFAEEVLKRDFIRLKGLMCIPNPNREEKRVPFARLREVRGRCPDMMEKCLSMGMSADYQFALFEGATHLRLGSVIFGERSK